MIGQFVDLETISTFKNFLNRLGVSGPGIWEQSTRTNLDCRAQRGRLNQTSIASEHDLVMLVGVNPRLEASSLNINLRTLAVRSMKVIAFGYFANLTYGKSHPGNGMELLMRVASGKGPACVVRNTIHAKNATFMLGCNSGHTSARGPVNSIRAFRDKYTHTPSSLSARGRSRGRRCHRNSSNHNAALALVVEDAAEEGGAGAQHSSDSLRLSEINVLASEASTPAAWELGCGHAEKDARNVYLIGVDPAGLEKISAKDWIIYQGHHGDIGARKATVILPSTAYSEKNGTYISLYHTIQRTEAAVQHCGEARDDDKIIQALADILFQPSLVSFEEASFGNNASEKTSKKDAPLTPLTNEGLTIANDLSPVVN